MIDLGPHAGFIFWAYAGVVIGVAGVILYTLWDARHVKARLKTLDDKGIRRRSAGVPGKAPPDSSPQDTSSQGTAK